MVKGKYVHQEHVHFQCEHGTSLESGVDVIVCKDGSWTAKEMKCVGRGECGGGGDEGGGSCGYRA